MEGCRPGAIRQRNSSDSAKVSYMAVTSRGIVAPGTIMSAERVVRKTVQTVLSMRFCQYGRECCGGRYGLSASVRKMDADREWEAMRKGMGLVRRCRFLANGRIMRCCDEPRTFSCGHEVCLD